MFVKNNTKIVMKYDSQIKLYIFLKKNKWRIKLYIFLKKNKINGESEFNSYFMKRGKITLEGKGDVPAISSSKERLKVLLLVKGLSHFLN